MFSFLILITFLTIAPTIAQADVPLQLLRRIAVFPIHDANFSHAEDAWWQMRELLTKDQRFFVASPRRYCAGRYENYSDLLKETCHG